MRSMTLLAVTGGSATSLSVTDAWAEPRPVMDQVCALRLGKVDPRQITSSYTKLYLSPFPKRAFLPRGPRGEKRPADVIGTGATI